jgi:hypothetical protein
VTRGAWAAWLPSGGSFRAHRIGAVDESLHHRLLTCWNVIDVDFWFLKARAKILVGLLCSIGSTASD